VTHTRIYFTIAGGHVHTEWFSAPKQGLTHGRNGDLVYTLREWETMRPVFEKFPEVFELIDKAKFVA
jgi:hypothetical protein